MEKKYVPMLLVFFFHHIWWLPWAVFFSQSILLRIYSLRSFCPFRMCVCCVRICVLLCTSVALLLISFVDIFFCCYMDGSSEQLFLLLLLLLYFSMSKIQYLFRSIKYYFFCCSALNPFYSAMIMMWCARFGFAIWTWMHACMHACTTYIYIYIYGT